MANFPTHVASGMVLGGMLATLAMAASAVTPTEVLSLTATCALGGVLPDIDLQKSRASQAMFSGLAIFIAFAVLFNLTMDYSIAEMWIVWVLTFVLVRYPGQMLFHKIAVHRGVFHSILAAVFFSLATAIVFTSLFGTGEAIAWLAAIFMLLGYVLHLILDEIYSVDVLNERIKASFGSALKIFDADYPVASLGMALATVGLFMLVPAYDAFLAMFTSADTWAFLNDRLLPRGQWFDGLLDAFGKLAQAPQNPGTTVQ